MLCGFHRLKNIVGKIKNAGFKDFLPIPTMSLQGSNSGLINFTIVHDCIAHLNHEPT